MIQVEISNQQRTHPIDESQICSAARAVLLGEGIEQANLSIAVVDQAAMHALNRQYLSHDYPTDVLSFTYGEGDAAVDGEVIVCADVAASAASDYGWQPAEELLLYVVHGVLHLAGYDDQTESALSEMRAKEVHYLRQFNLSPNYRHAAEAGPRTGSACSVDSDDAEAIRDSSAQA